MELYLHIGTEKTGTTSIQAFMAANRSLLQQHQILYPRSPGETNHIGLAGSAQDRERGELWKKLAIRSIEERDRYRARLEEELTAELRQHRYRCAIMSNEHCSSRLLEEAEVTALREFLSKFFSRVRIIVYLRRQDDFLVSTYSTGVKNGQTPPLRVPKMRRIDHRYNYAELLDRWVAVFGKENLICRKFEKTSLIGGDLLADFLDVTDCDSAWSWERPGALNSSLDAKCLEFLRLLNLQMARDERPHGLVPRLERISDGPLLDLSEEDRAAFMKMVRPFNRRVAKRFFGGVLPDSDDPLFAPRADVRARTSEAGLSPDDAVRIAARLLTMDPVKGRQRDRPVAFASGAPGPAVATAMDA
jgi:hypothetical protein